MNKRYLLRCARFGVEVYDCHAGDAHTAPALVGPMEFNAASEIADRMNKPPCCERAERYRQALTKIARHADCEYARRTADDALAEGIPA